MIGRWRSPFGPKGDLLELSTIFAASITLLKGAAAARLIALATIPVLARLYAPADFGLLASFTAVLTIIIPFATLRYALAIPIVRGARAATGLIAIGCYCLAGSTFVLLVICAVTVSLNQSLGSLHLNLSICVFLVVSYVLSGLYELLSNWSLRLRRYGQLAAVSAWQTFVTAVVKIAAGVIFRFPEALILGHVAGQAAGLGTLARSLDRRDNRKPIPAKSLLKLVKQLWQFPLFRLPSQFLLALSAQLPILFVAHQYSLESAGHFGLAMTVLTATVSVAATSIGQAFYGEIASVFRTDRRRIAAVTVSVQTRLLILGGAVAVALHFLAQPFVVYGLGEKWALTGSILSSLAPYVFTQIASAPMVRSMDLFRNQYIFLAINIVRAAIVFCVISYSRSEQYDVVSFSGLYSVAMALFYVLVCIVVTSVMCHISRRAR